MRVVNQARNTSVEMDAIIVVVTDNLLMADVLANGTTIVLGKFTTDERAKKVFDEMHEWYSKDITNTLKYESEELLDDAVKALHSQPIWVSGITNDSMMAVVDSHNDVYYIPEM